MNISRARSAVILLLGAWLAAWLARQLVINLTGRQNAIHSAAGYAATVDLFLTHDWLRYNPATQTITPSFQPRSAMARFYQASYLARDVAAWNGGKRSVFRVENNRILELDPNLHNIPLPFARLRSWPGLLTYRPRQGLRAELRGDGVTIELSGPSHSLRSQHDLPRVVVRRQGAQEPRVRVQGEAVNI
ncbi:MAG: hypothetical protein M3O15_01830, partial [Acidobacteriota bacterium]|nr:hypothetical protein [Acidobacteriota bacterium]